MVRVALWIVLAGCAGAPARPSLEPALLEWSTGINLDKPGVLVETVLPAVDRGQHVWRIVHRDGEPTVDDVDAYDVSDSGLAPIRSVSHRDGVALALTFERGHVVIDRRSADAHVTETVATHDPVPEGPGQTVWLAALPLAPGYRATVEVVDRWAADLAHPIREVEVAVVAMPTLVTPLGRCRTYAVDTDAKDGSFRIRTYVRASPPRYPVRVEYRRGDDLYVSQVVRLVVAGERSPCP